MARFKKKKMGLTYNLYSDDPTVIREELDKLNESPEFIKFLNEITYVIFQIKILNKTTGIIIN